MTSKSQRVEVMTSCFKKLVQALVSDENGTYYDRESYILDPKLTLTCNALRRKVPILYRIGKKYSASSASRVKKYLAL